MLPLDRGAYLRNFMRNRMKLPERAKRSEGFWHIDYLIYMCQLTPRYALFLAYLRLFFVKELNVLLFNSATLNDDFNDD
nr:MAG: hypothetical protein [Microvirus sp.]